MFYETVSVPWILRTGVDTGDREQTGIAHHEEASPPMDRRPIHIHPRPETPHAKLSFVVDLDGTLVHGRTVIPGAADLIRQIDDRFVIVSNNSTHSACGLATELAAAGLEIPDSRIILAGVMAVQRVALDYPGARVLLIGSPALRREADRAGLILVQDGADVVLLGRDEAFSYDKLALAANEIRRGATLVACNPDRYHPGANGLLVPETGALMQAIIACASPPNVRVIGKPQPDLFQEAVRRLNSTPAACVMIGDNPETDAAGAARLGMPHLLVGSGTECDASDLVDLTQRLSRDQKSLTAFPRLASA